MGWTDTHLHSFTIAGEEFSPSPEEPDDGHAESGVVLGALVTGPHSSFTYEYDFGDDWVHTIIVESVGRIGDHGRMQVVCLDGRGQCPPENVGGPDGFAAFRRAQGGSFDAKDFSAEAVNAELVTRGLTEWTHLERLASEIPMNADDEIYAGGFNHRDEANALIAMAVRNGPIESLHAGRHSPLIEDSTLSRLTDDEIKSVMIHATKCLAGLLRLRDSSPELYQRYVREYGKMYCRFWEREN